MKRGDLGIAVIGAGRIGTLRPRLAAKHPAVGFLAIADLLAPQAESGPLRDPSPSSTWGWDQLP
jgi:hypothetical protein